MQIFTEIFVIKTYFYLGSKGNVMGKTIFEPSDMTWENSRNPNKLAFTPSELNYWYDIGGRYQALSQTLVVNKITKIW